MTDKESKRKERLLKRQKKAQKKAEKKQARKQQPLPKKIFRFASLTVVAVVAVIFMLASIGTVAHATGLLNGSSVEKQFNKIQKKIATLDKKKSNLVDMRLDEKIDKETYEMKFTEITLKLDELLKERTSLENSLDNEHTMKKRLAEFRKTLQNNQLLDEFYYYVFESIVEKVIVGGVEEDGTIDPHKLVFIYKTGLTDSQDGGKFKSKRKNAKKSNDTVTTDSNLCSQASDEDNKLCSHTSNYTCRKRYITNIEKINVQRQSSNGDCLFCIVFQKWLITSESVF